MLFELKNVYVFKRDSLEKRKIQRNKCQKEKENSKDVSLVSVGQEGTSSFHILHQCSSIVKTDLIKLSLNILPVILHEEWIQKVNHSKQFESLTWLLIVMHMDRICHRGRAEGSQASHTHSTLVLFGKSCQTKTGMFSFHSFFLVDL